MKTEIINYTYEDKTFNGFLANEESIPGPKPAIIIAHAWKGQGQFARDKALFLAQQGYIGFAADLYGDGKCVTSNEEALELMTPLFVNRQLLRDRIVSAFEVMENHPQVDRQKIGAIGFCFGGLTVIELLRSGRSLQGVVSFHGLLGNAIGEIKAETAPPADKIHGSLMILHGHQDPMVSLQDIVTIQNEFSSAGIDWQMHIYGDAAHAFTNPDANEPESGLVYHERTEKRAMQSMRHFFDERFQ